MKKNTEYQLIMPFGDEFAKNWEIWKQYKWASHNFKYKSVFSEQAAIEQLVTLSKGEEEKAVKIIKQSMRREWQGLFPLHETTTGNGKQPDTKKRADTSGLESDSEDVLKRRNAERGQSDYGTNLKAV